MTLGRYIGRPLWLQRCRFETCREISHTLRLQVSLQPRSPLNCRLHRKPGLILRISCAERHSAPCRLFFPIQQPLVSQPRKPSTCGNALGEPSDYALCTNSQQLDFQNPNWRFRGELQTVWELDGFPRHIIESRILNGSPMRVHRDRSGTYSFRGRRLEAVERCKGLKMAEGKPLFNAQEVGKVIESEVRSAACPGAACAAARR
jgi:hypothetical protein